MKLSYLIATLWCIIYCQEGTTGSRQSSNLPDGPTSEQVFNSEEKWPEGIRVLRKLAKRDDEDNEDQQQRRLKTKIVDGVEVLVRDYDTELGRDWPLTLVPRLVQDGFAIDINTASQILPSSVIKTEYSTFTYFITSLDGSQTVTSTDIVVSSNEVTETLKATPALPAQQPDQQQTTSVPSGFQIMATKTYFTTSTYYTTLIDQSRTLTKTRTKVKSSVVTETFAAPPPKNSFGSIDTEIKPTLVPGDNQVKYLSFGPNIYGKITTLFATYTYFTTDLQGSIAESKEVIAQVSTSLFSTTQLPPSITLAQTASKSVQLNQEDLLSLKESFLAAGGSAAPEVPISSSQVDGVISTKPGGAQVLWDKPHLSSLKESFEASISTEDAKPETDLNLPINGPGLITPPTTGDIKPTRPVEEGSNPDTIVDKPLEEPDVPQGIPNPQEQGEDDSETDGGVGATNQVAQGFNPGLGGPPPDLETSQSQTSNAGGNINNAETSNSNNGETSNNNNNSGGGFINAVVGGIADGLGLGNNNNNGENGAPINSGIQVDLGPVLDAVATLLRGPIRSAIANRRSEYLQQRSDSATASPPLRPSARVELPHVVRERNDGQPLNFIPIGNSNRLRASGPHSEEPNAIPLRYLQPEQRNANGSPAQVILPRKDIEGELEYVDPLQVLPNDVQHLLRQHKDKNIVVDGEHVIINGHIVKPNVPTIVDVLNRKEQGHLFGQDDGGPMAIKILPGTPMDVPKQTRIPGKPLDPNEVTMIGSLEDEVPPPPPPAPQNANRPRPTNFNVPKHQLRRPLPPRRPEHIRPPPLPQHGPRGARPPPQIRPALPKERLPGDLDDSVKEYSVNDEVAVNAPLNTLNKQNNGRPLQNKRPPPPGLKQRPSSQNPPRFNRPPPNQQVHQQTYQQQSSRPDVENGNEQRPQFPPNNVRQDFKGRPPPPPPQNRPQNERPFNQPPQNRPPPPQNRQPPPQNRPPPPQNKPPQNRPPPPPPQSRPLVNQVPQQQPNRPPNANVPQQNPRPISSQPRPSNLPPPPQNRPTNQPQALENPTSQTYPANYQNQPNLATNDQRVPTGLDTPRPSVQPSTEPVRPKPKADEVKQTEPVTYPTSVQQVAAVEPQTKNEGSDRAPPLPPSSFGKKPQFGQKLPPLKPTESQKPRLPIVLGGEKRRQPPTNKNTNNNALNKNDQREYTQIDEPSREPQYGDPLGRPAVGGGNRYEANGSRRPYTDNNPNRERRPAAPLGPVPVIGVGNQIIKYDTQNQNDYKSNSEDIGERPIQIDPSFTVGAGYISGVQTPPAFIDKTVAIGTNPKLIQGSVEDSRGDTTLDYQGWYTEGDTLQVGPPEPSTSRFYTDLNIQETEAVKTTTYANEWSTPLDDYRTQIPFETKSRPQLNTNFDREWTAGYNNGNGEEVRPTRPGFGLRVTDYDPRENNNWNTVGSRRPPLTRPREEINESNPTRQPLITPENYNNADGEGETFPDTSLLPGQNNRPLRPVNRPGLNGRPAPVGEAIVFGKRPQPNRLPPIQQPPTGNDVIGIPNAVPPTNEDVARPQRRPISTGQLPPQDGQIDKLDTDEDDNIRVIEGTFENRPVLPLQTDNLPFTTKSIEATAARPGQQESSPTRRTRIRLTTRPLEDESTEETTVAFVADRSSSSTSLSRTFPPGTFINIDPTSVTSRRFSPASDFRIRPTIAVPTPNVASSAEEDLLEEPPTTKTPVVVTRPRGERPAVFPPKIIRDESKSQESAIPPRAEPVTEPEVKAAGIPPFLPPFGKRQKEEKDEVKRKETVISDKINPAIVEGIPGNALSAEDSDPETRCQNTCGQNEICQINARGGIECKCRPGFGRTSNSSPCEKSLSYQIEVLTGSESREEITVVRLSPKAVEKGLQDALRKNFKNLYHGSELTSIRVGNDTKRDIFYGGEKNLTRDQDVAIGVLVHLAQESNNVYNTEEKLRSVLESPIKDTKLPLGADVTVSRVSVADFDECSSSDHNDCADFATCFNTEGSYTCSCKEGFHDLSGPDSLPGRVCSSTTTECDLCNKNGKCVADELSVVKCECRPWFAGRNCQINLKLLLIVGCVSVILMIVIACGVSCFCCRDRNAAKNSIPSPYGTSLSRMPTNMGRAQGFMMDPNAGKPKHPMKPTMMPRPGIMQKPQHMSYSGSSVASQPNSLTHRQWQEQTSSAPPQAHLMIPRAKVKPRSTYHGYNSDEDAEANRAMSEHNSMGSRHRRKSIPSYASNMMMGSSTRGSRRSRSSPRAGSIDPLLDSGSLSDGAESGTLHISVSRGDLDRADTRSEARSYNETIIRPVTRRLNTPAGTSYRSSRSHATTSEDGRTMAERDGGSSFVVSPRHNQLYRLHDSDGSLDSL